MIHEQNKIVNKEQQTLNQAISNLPENWAPKFEATTCCEQDGLLSLFENRYHFTIELKRVHRKESLQKLSVNFPSNKILICNTLSSFLADYCEQQKINFIDASGNARIQYQDLHIHIQGRKSKEHAKNSTPNGQALSEGAMKLAFTLLNDRTLLNRPYRELAKLSGTSLGMVSKGMSFLEGQKYIRPSKSGRKFIDDGRPLQDKWLNDYISVLRPKLNGIMLDYVGDWQDFDNVPDYFLGGEALAAKLTHYLHPEQLQIYTFKPFQEVIYEYHALPQNGGNLWLVTAFWGTDLQITEYGMALLGVAELRCSPDSRNMELAKILHEQYLAIV